MEANKPRSEPMDVDEPQSTTSSQRDLVDGEIDHISDDEDGSIRIGDIYIPPAPKPVLSFDASGPRLIITHIVNENFKSYAGVQSLGPFHKSFTAIIGPNGSGKSNVIDSMLFVFGYRASKIRSKKISVLIHSSSKYPNIKSASVAVHFSQIIDGEGEDFTVVPNSEIVVSRTAFKDNSSHYTLNGKRVQFKEVAKMLRFQGIDLDHNRFLILQGEVEQIAMMKSKAQSEHESGMLEYLEDIVGTSRYKEPIGKLAIKVEEFTEVRKEKLNRVRLVEQEKQKLEQPMREALALVNLTNDALRTRNMLLQKYIHETNIIIETKENEMTESKEVLAKIDETLRAVEEELKEKTNTLTTGTQKYDVLQKEKEETAEKLQSSKRKLVSIQADTTQLNKKKKNLEQLLEQEKSRLIDLELIPEKNEREIQDCDKLLNKYNEAKVKAEEELQIAVAGVRSQTQGLQETKDQLQAKLMELKNIVDETNRKFKLAESELKIYLSTEQKETEKLKRMQEAYQKAVNELEEKKTLHSQLSTSVPANETLKNQIQTQLDNLKTEEAQVLTESRTLRAQLEESKQAMSATRSRGKVLDALMREKNNGNMPGIFGRLGDLGGIDPKYDVAISTCCGALDNIVVDNVETAQTALEYLKRHDIGRATFLALDKQQHLQRSYQLTCYFPENVPRLFDLVKVNDERVLPAFYYALRDTLVANDLEQASRIAYGATRYRVVTLKGDVIEIAGTMSGGGKTMLRGRMGSAAQQDTSHRASHVQADEDRLAELQHRLSEIRTEQGSLEESLTNVVKKYREEKTASNKLQIELNNLTQQVPDIKNQIKHQEKRAAASRVDAGRRAALESELQHAQQHLQQAQHNAAQVESEVQEVDAKISAIAGGRVKDLQKNVDEISKKIDKVSTEITKLKVGVNSSLRNAKKSKDKINQMNVDLKETEKHLEILGNQKKQATLDSAEMHKKIEQLEEQISEGVEEFSGLKQEIKTLQTKENKLKNERLEANNAVLKLMKLIQDCKSKTPQWEKELRSLKLEDPGLEGIAGVERPAPLQQHSHDELRDACVETLRDTLAAQRERIGGNKPNLQAIQDYKAKEDLFLRRAAELDDITAKRNEMRAVHEQLKKKRNTDFLCGFNTITMKLKEMYQMITLGGDAELELVDSLDPFSEGITFSVRPPNKSWKNISNLSGGEKTLSSLALVFALHYYRPTPLYVMDEIDAALDFKNVSIVANYIKERTRNAQFIIISLRYNMFEVSNRLVGIYKTEDCTKSVAIDNKMPEPESVQAAAT